MRFTFAAAGVALITALAAAPAVANAPPLPGTAAPAFSSPIILNGHGTLSLSSFKGHPVYLNFFASWCPPCKAELPYIATLARRFAKRGVVVIGIDELESDSRAVGFAKKFALPYPIVVDGNGAIGGLYGLAGMPLHVFISPSGRVALWHPGEMSEQAVLAELQALTRH